MLEISDVHDLCQRISDENDSKKAEQLMFALRGVLQSNPQQLHFRLEYIARYWPQILGYFGEYLHQQPQARRQHNSLSRRH